MKKIITVFICLSICVSVSYARPVLNIDNLLSHYKDAAMVKSDSLKVWLELLNSKGVIPESPDKMFFPDKAITFEELATWMFRASGEKEHLIEKDLTKDVPGNYWRAAHIKYMMDNNMIYLGFNGKIDHDTEMTGADIIRILTRYEELFFIENNKLEQFSLRPEMFDASNDLQYMKVVSKATALKYFVRTSYLKRFISQ